MTLGQLDDVLKAWQARLSAVAENLLELQTDSTYQSLTGTGGLDKVSVTGATLARVGPALRSMNSLYGQFGSLQATVDQAQALRRGLPTVFGGEAKLREAEQLLFGPSIEIEVPELPLAQRTLVSGLRSTTRVTPEQLLQTMTQTFAEVQAAVAAVGRAWTDFADRYDRVDREIARLRAQTALPSASLQPSLDALAGNLNDLRGHVHTDPLGALAHMGSTLDAALAAVSQRVATAEQTASRLRSARCTWESLGRLHGEAGTLADEAHAKVAGDAPGPQPLPQDKLQSLGKWLLRLESKHQEGALEAVGVGLRNWMAAADACLAYDRSVVDVLSSRLSARGELRGRFDALKAKARAYGLAERSDVSALASAAEHLLYARPVHLEHAGAAVARYEEQLRTRTKSGEAQRSAAAQ